MTYNAQQGHLGIRTQSSKGVYADPGAVAPNQGVFMRTRSGAMSGDRELMIPDPEIGGNRDIPDALLSPVGFKGEFDFYARMESMATLLKAAMGSAGSAGAAATGYTHTIACANSIPWLSLEEQVANSYMVFKYTDCKVQSLHIEADANGYLMGNVGLVGLTQATTTATASGDQRWDTSPYIVGSNITVAWNGVTLPARSMSFDLNNNIEDDDFRLGSLFLGDAAEKRREVTVGVSIRPEDAALWKTATWGTAAATAPGGVTTKDDVVITITTYEMIPGSTGPEVPYLLTFTAPQAILKPFTLDPSGDDIMQHDMEIQFVRPDPTVALFAASLKNSYATVA